MQKFGEMCITTYRDNTHQAKLANHGTSGVWVGCTEGHSIGTYQIFNPKMKKIILTWDVTFLQKSYGEYSKVEKPVLVTKSYEGLDCEEELEMFPISVNNNNLDIDPIRNTDIENDIKNVSNNKIEVSPKTTIKTKVIWTMKKL